MKSVMLSIKPKWCEMIANGRKTIEVRKTKPQIPTPFKCYIYCTKPSKKHQTICGCMKLNNDELYRHPTEGLKYGDSIELMLCDDYSKDNFLNGKIIGEFICDEITSGYWIAPFEDYLQSASCLTTKELTGYSDGKLLHYWHISDLKIYDKPKMLDEFKNAGALSYEDWLYGLYNGTTQSTYENYLLPFKLKKPPQSWHYVEEV